MLAAVVRPRPRLLLAALGGFLVASACILVPFAGVASQLWKSVVSFHLNGRDISGPRRHRRPAGQHRAHRLGVGDGFGHRRLVDASRSSDPPRSCAAPIGPTRPVVACVAGHCARVPPLADAAFRSPCRAPRCGGGGSGRSGVCARGAGFLPAAAARRRGRSCCWSAPGLRGLGSPTGASSTGGRQEGCRSAPGQVSPGFVVLATDQPIVAFLAHRPVPPQLVDTSWVRLVSGSLTRQQVLAVVRTSTWKLSWPVRGCSSRRRPATLFTSCSPIRRR